MTRASGVGGVTECGVRAARVAPALGSVLGAAIVALPMVAAAQLLPTPTEPIAEGISRAVAADHSCARTDSGGVFCWGNNLHGQLGNRTWGLSTVPVPVAEISRVAQIAVAERYSCALRDEGTVWCWGDTDVVQSLRIPRPTDDPAETVAIVYDTAGTVYTNAERTFVRPIQQVPGLTGIVALAAGSFHSCALKSDGTVWCWGNNTYGQLGAGESVSDTPTPVQVGSLAGVARIATGAMHSCAVKTDGTVWCWGQNTYKQLGNQSAGSIQYTPVQVEQLSGAVRVTAGASHTCAGKSDGTVWCWGNNRDGQLGDGTMLSQSTPVLVAGLAGAGDLAAGFNHTCAIRSEDQTVVCWGRNGQGQLGNGTTTRSATPVAVVTALGSPLRGAAWLGGGVSHSCARLQDRSVMCWGSNAVGQLGDGLAYFPRPFAAPALLLF